MRRKGIIALVFAGGLAGCGGGGDIGPVTFYGQIDSIDGTDLSWDGLRFGLITISYHEEGGETLYDTGDEYRALAIGPDHRFSFDLPGQIEPGWVGEVSFTTSSPLFVPMAYMDTNGNGRFDSNRDLSTTEPHTLLTDSGARFGVVFIADPDAFAERYAVDVTRGWHIERAGPVGIAYVPDFDREYVLAP